MRISVILAFLAIAARGEAPLLAGDCARPILAMTYNIRLDTPADGQNSWTHRKNLLIGQIDTLRPEILGMQEVLPNQRADMEMALPQYHFVGGGRDDGRLAGEASPLAIDRRRFRILASGTFWLSPTPQLPSLGWDAGFRRVVTWAHLKGADGIRLLAINTHWDHQGALARRESGRLILSWMTKNLQKDEELVLLGDLNAEATEESVAQLTEHSALRDTRSASITPSTGGPISFNAFEALPKSGKLIDHIFVSPGIVVKAHSVVAQHENGHVPSDHFPVVALLDLPVRGKQQRACSTP